MAGRWIKRSIKRAARKGSVIGKRKKRGIINKAKRKAGDIAYKVGQTKPVRKTIKKIEDFSAVDALDRTIERSGIRKILNPKKRKKKPSKYKKPSNWPER